MALFKVKSPKIGGTIGNIAGQVKKAAGDVYSATTKQPTQAIYQSVKQGSAQPMKEYAGNVWSQSVKQPMQKIGQAIGAMSQGGGAGPEQGAAGSPPDYSQFKLNLTSSNPTMAQPNTPDQLSQQYANMQSLAKMREGAAASGEQAAIQRRLAASGMGASGAGMRMQQQADQASARRLAEQQLGIGAEQAAAMQRAGESAADRDFRERQFEYQKQRDQAEFETNKKITEENQKIAREIQRYNNAGMFQQLGWDFFGKDTSMKYPFAWLGAGPKSQ
jgi:hypothetical protein